MTDRADMAVLLLKGCLTATAVMAVLIGTVFVLALVFVAAGG